MTQAIFAACIAQPMRPAPINPEWIRGGAPMACNVEIFRSRDGLARTVLWECTPGLFDWVYDVDETIHILEGSVLLEDGLSPPRRYGAGDVVYFPAGAHVRWTVEERVRKLAFFRRGLPRPAAALVRTLRRLKLVLRPAPESFAPM